MTSMVFADILINESFTTNTSDLWEYNLTGENYVIIFPDYTNHYVKLIDVGGLEDNFPHEIFRSIGTDVIPYNFTLTSKMTLGYGYQNGGSEWFGLTNGVQRDLYAWWGEEGNAHILGLYLRFDYYQANQVKIAFEDNTEIPTCIDGDQQIRVPYTDGNYWVKISRYNDSQTIFQVYSDVELTTQVVNCTLYDDSNISLNYIVIGTDPSTARAPNGNGTITDIILSTQPSSMPEPTPTPTPTPEPTPTPTPPQNYTIPSPGGGTINIVLSSNPGTSINSVTTTSTSINIDCTGPGFTLTNMTALIGDDGFYSVYRNSIFIEKSNNATYTSATCSLWNFIKDVTGYSSTSCFNTRNVIFSALLLIALGTLISAATVIIFMMKGDFDATAIIATTIGIIAVGIVVFVGFLVISNISDLTCIFL